MDKTQQAAQLRLAADLLETGHPWEWQASDGEWVKPTIRTELSHVVSDGLIIRPVLATPPDNRPLHNPDNLTAEQVGVGYRLLCAEDGVPIGKVDTWLFGGWCSAYVVDKQRLPECRDTYRLPLRIPWPEPADPYADLKKAHAEGKVIQILDTQNRYVDADPTRQSPPERYRIKPDAPTFQLPPPPPGIQWHKKDGWEEGDLPQGWRPLVVGEEEHDEDEFGLRINNAWMPTPDRGKVVGAYDKVRTRRPLTFTHEGTTWTWHRPDDPMPCDGEKQVVLLRSNREEFATNEYSALGKKWTWDDPLIIGWRYADEKKTAPLGPEMREFPDMIKGRCSKPA